MTQSSGLAMCMSDRGGGKGWERWFFSGLSKCVGGNVNTNPISTNVE